MRKNLITWSMGLIVSFVVTLPGVAADKRLTGHVPVAVAHLQSNGRLQNDQVLKLAIGLPLRNQDALDDFIQQLYDPSSSAYHHYLTPEQFAAQFAPTETDYQKVINFAKTNGLTVTGVFSNRVLVDVSGKISDIEKAFHVTLRTYPHPNGKRNFYAPDEEPSVNETLPMLHISGLDNYIVPHPSLHKIRNLNTVAGATPAAGSFSGSYLGNDFRNAYVPGSSLNGSGQMVGLLEFDSGFYQSDINTYEIQAGLPTSIPVVPVLLDGYDGSPGVNNDEVSLDIEMVIAMASGISQIYVFEGENTDDILNAMAQKNQIKQLSASWGYPIDATSEQIFKQFAAQGQSFFNCSGDGDAWVGPIFTPCDDPYVTIVGGTTLTTATNGNWASETVWNSGFQGNNTWNVAGYWGSSGGISTAYTIPSWQTNVNMTTNHGSTIMRNVPDVALTADNIAVSFGGGLWGVFEGTSAATPLWAGYMALVNQQAATGGKSPIGFLNPIIYNLAASANYTNYFHDIKTGNNFWPQSPTNFPAVPGYDLCTGWGTPNGINLINALVGMAPTHVSPPQPPYGTTLSALNGGNPNGNWELFVQDDQLQDSGMISSGWFLSLTTSGSLGAMADNEITMTNSVGSIVSGHNVTFYIGVTNWGPSTSSNVYVSDILPSGAMLLSTNVTQGSISGGSLLIWNVGTLATNAGAQLTLTVQANSSGTNVDSATVGATTPDPNPDDDTRSASVNVIAPTPPSLSGTIVATNGVFQFSVTGATGQTNVIEASTNLVIWIPIYTNVSPFNFTDPNATNYPTRFYRDRALP